MQGERQTVADRLEALDAGRTTATELLEHALAQARGEQGRLAHVRLFEAKARAAAEADEARRRGGVPGGTLAGLPIAVKDVFDVAGENATAGSRILAERAPAARDAEVVRRLRAAGAVITGHNNMTEFAYSGLGLNPHYGTPANPHDAERIPGGSSCGAGVAVAGGMAVAAIGTDTGGSVRIPAAFSGLVGFKPTQTRVPREGMVPLSATLDSIGPIAPSVACCVRLDAVLAGERYRCVDAMPVRGLRLAVPMRYVLDDLDASVSAAFERSLSRLSAAGARVEERPFKLYERLPELGYKGGFSAAESYRTHREWLAVRASEYDPRVAQRMRQAETMHAADYLDLRATRAELMAAADEQTADWDALVMPTVAVVPPRFAELAQDEEYDRINRLVLRNPTVVNLLGQCAITLPCHAPGELPVGLMLVGRALSDRALLRVAAGVEGLHMHNA